MKAYLVSSKCTEGSEVDQTVIINADDHLAAFAKAIRHLDALCRQTSGWFADNYVKTCECTELGMTESAWQFMDTDDVPIWDHFVIELVSS